MAIDFSKTTLEYNEGFIDGLLWVMNNGNKAAVNEIEKMVSDIQKANNKILNGEEKFEKL